MALSSSPIAADLDGPLWGDLTGSLIPSLFGFGPAVSFAAASVLSLYLQSGDIRTLYRDTALFWAVFPACLHWLIRVWLLASPRKLNEKPIAFAVRDRTMGLVIGSCDSILWIPA
jgi:hypothetical protein